MIDKLWSGHKQTIRQFLFFAVVGTVGFLVDTAILYLLKSILGLYVSRVISFFCAVYVTWLLNRNWTFYYEKTAHKRSQFLLYLWLMVFGGVINFTVYSILVYYKPLVVSYPVVGVGVGSIAGMFANFMTSKRFVFKSSFVE